MTPMTPVEKAKPPAGRPVLGSCYVGSCGTPEVLIVEYHGAGYWTVSKTGEPVKVIAWQLLPEHIETAKSDKKHCEGCHCDFYNDKNPIGVKECWSFQRARVVTRFRLSVNTPSNERDGYEKMETHDCRRDDGYVFVEKIPEFAR